MRLDKFILLPGYSAERILISAAIEQIAGSACIANNSNLVPSYFSTPRAREREWTLGTRLKQPQPTLTRFQKPSSFSCNKNPLKALRRETKLGGKFLFPGYWELKQSRRRAFVRFVNGRCHF